MALHPFIELTFLLSRLQIISKCLHLVAETLFIRYLSTSVVIVRNLM